jgi:methyl-accepting chemotaxis protein
VAATGQGLSAIQASSAEVRQALGALSAATQRIDVIVESIQSIAAETHILSLNASIEASRAGEAGRGFAVVAKAVRALAERSALSGREIREIVAGTQLHMRAAQAAMLANVAAVEQGAQSSSVLTRTFQAIEQAARETHTSVADMTTVLKEQTQATERTASIVRSVAEVATESLAASDSILRQGDTLHEMVQELEKILSRFDLREGAAPPAAAPTAPPAAGRPADLAPATPA